MIVSTSILSSTIKPEEIVKKLDCTEENDKLVFTNIKNPGTTYGNPAVTMGVKK